ncbi:MAG: methionyl-tRNA formyltransferase [Phycisphaerales bacterium]
MRVVFFGSGEFGRPTLEHLAKSHEVLTAVSQPDRPAGRGGKSTPTPIGAWSAERGLPLIKPENVNEPGVVESLRALRADAWVVIAFGQKLSPPLLEGQRAMNLHASLLPRWRGAAPINAAILAGDAETGNSVITLADRMDAGLVLATSRRAIEPSYTTADLHALLSADGPALVESCLARAAREWPFGDAQDPSKVTHARKLSKEDGWVDFAQRAESCRNRIHGLNPWPTVDVGFRDLTLKLLRASTASGAGEPGEIIDPGAGLVACGEGTALELLEVQAPGKRAMTWKEFAAGRRPEKGERLRGTARP